MTDADRLGTQPPATGEQSLPGLSPASAKPPPTRRRILAVDDEPAFTRMLKLNLESTGRYEVVTVNWPEDALPAARKFQPELVLLDVFMPRMVGGDVATQLRKDPQFRTTPIVFLTAAIRSSTELVQEHAGVASDVAFIAKPASADEIIDAIEKHLPA